MDRLTQFFGSTRRLIPGACIRVLFLALLAAQSEERAQAAFPPSTDFELGCINGNCTNSTVCVASTSYATVCTQGIAAHCVGFPIDMQYVLNQVGPPCLWNLVFVGGFNPGSVFRVDQPNIVARSSCPDHATLLNGDCTCDSPYLEVAGACTGAIYQYNQRSVINGSPVRVF